MLLHPSMAMLLRYLQMSYNDNLIIQNGPCRDKEKIQLEIVKKNKCFIDNNARQVVERCVRTDHVATQS